MGKLCRVVRCSALALIALVAAERGTSAQAPVTDFITVQPIDVCLSSVTTGTMSCAAMNNLGSSLNNVVTAGQNVQVGFASGGINLTQQILNLGGMEVVFLPTVEDIVTDPTLTNIVVNQTQVNPTSVFDSTTLRGLTDQTLPNSISQGSAPAPTPPLSSNPTTINMFFVNSLIANPNTGPLYGISWIGNNGIAISQSIFGSTGRGGVTVNARADTIAHEIGHNLGLDHTTFGNQNQPASDLMSQGTLRTLPTVGVGNNAGQAWLGQIAGGTVDQLNSQQAAAITNTSVDLFANPIPNVTVSGSDPSLNFNFTVNFPAGDTSGESLTKLTFQLPDDFEDGDVFFFNSGVTITQPTDPNVIVQVANCTDSEESNCLSFTFEHGEGLHNLETGDSFSFSVGICEQIEDFCMPATDTDLASSLNPALMTYTFSDGYQTTSDLLPVSDPTFTSSSQNPDPTIGGTTLVNFTPFSNLGCVTATNICPTLVLADGNPADDTSVPEPSSIALLVAPLCMAFAFATAQCRRTRNRRAIA